MVSVVIIGPSVPLILAARLKSEIYLHLPLEPGQRPGAILCVLPIIQNQTQHQFTLGNMTQHLHLHKQGYKRLL